MLAFTYQDYCKYKHSVISTYNCVKENDDSPPYTVHSMNNDNINYHYSIKDVHDKLYRDFFNDTMEFSLFLEYFLNINIPYIELSPYNGGFITEDYKNRHSDVVYKINNKPIYILLEHQSSVDYSISYRIFDYYSLILRNTVDMNSIKNKNYELPVIIPILLYTGNRKWDLEPNLKNMQHNNSFRNNILDFRYDYVNIFNYSIEELLNIDSMIAYLLATDKCKKKNELLTVLEKLSHIVTSNSRKHSIKRLIIYIYKDFFDDTIRNELLEKFEKGDDVSMKYAWDYVKEDIKRMRARDERKGIKKGRQEGLLEGIRKNAYEMISKMLKNGESIDKIKLYSGYSKEEIEKIRKEM